MHAESRLTDVRCYRQSCTYTFGLQIPSNAVSAGPVSALRWVSLSAYAADGKLATCSKGDAVQLVWGIVRWEHGDFIRTRYHSRLLSISLQETWRTGDIHRPMNKDARIQHRPYADMIRNHKARLTVNLGGPASLSPTVHTACTPSLILVAAVQSPLPSGAQCMVGAAPGLSAPSSDHRCCPGCSFGRGRWARSG